MSKLKDGLSTRLFNFFLYFFGVRKKPTYSTTLDDGFVLKEIPSAYPVLGSEHSVVNDLEDFRVVSIDEDKSIITIREIKSDLDFQLSVDAFDLLFTPKTNKTDTSA